MVRKVPHYMFFSSRSKLYYHCRICDLDMDEEEVVGMKPDTSQCSIVSCDYEGLCTSSESRSECEKDQRKILKDQRISE